jgi:uncharacterized protein
LALPIDIVTVRHVRGREGSDGARRLEELSYEDCMARLARKRLGRLVLVLDHQPEVFPVNYGLDDNAVVFRTRPGTRLMAAHQARVAFHVDHHDEATRSGWSVLVQGMAEDVTDRTDDLATQRTRAVYVDSWVPGHASRILRIIPARVTGRQINAGELTDWSDERGELL